MRTSPSLSLGRPARPAKAPAGGISARLFYSIFAGLLGTNVITAVAFTMSPDIASLMGGQTDLILSAYEDRIAQLRVEVDRLHSRHYAQAGDLNLQLQELAQQQELLTEQHQYVEVLARKASELGIQTAIAASDDEAPAVKQSLAPISSASPATPRQKLETAAQSLQQMMGETQLALAAISEAATTSTDEILDQLRRIGIRPKLPPGAEGVGGPLLPAQDGADADSLVQDANAVLDALGRFKAAREAIDEAPIHRPVAGSLRLSSRFGNRTDPFTRGKAFHAGIDFAGPEGTAVLSAGGGVVSFVGQKSGYGNVVEIDHGHGIVTRYAHLSKFLVEEGQAVNTGTPIARVGTTGRSTGPHLHFEVRRGDTAVDPAPFLAAGRELARFLA